MCEMQAGAKGSGFNHRLGHETTTETLSWVGYFYDYLSE